MLFYPCLVTRETNTNSPHCFTGCLVTTESSTSSYCFISCLVTRETSTHFLSFIDCLVTIKTSTISQFHWLPSYYRNKQGLLMHCFTDCMATTSTSTRWFSPFHWLTGVQNTCPTTPMSTVQLNTCALLTLLNKKTTNKVSVLLISKSSHREIWQSHRIKTSFKKFLNTSFFTYTTSLSCCCFFLFLACICVLCNIIIYASCLLSVWHWFIEHVYYWMLLFMLYMYLSVRVCTVFDCVSCLFWYCKVLTVFLF